MALFTDGTVSTIEDLVAQDSQLLDIASIEGIDLTRKLALAQDEAALALETLLSRFRPGSARSNLDGVVVTKPLRAWHTLRSLEMVYTDAFHNQQNDRYARKLDLFQKRVRGAYERVIECGIGLVKDPVTRPVTPDVTAAAGGLPDGTYYITMSWVNAAGEEGESAVAAAVTTTGSTFRVTPGPPPENACGWHVYAGDSMAQLVRQNGALIPVDQTWIQADALIYSGKRAGEGQSPNSVQAVPRLLQRG